MFSSCSCCATLKSIKGVGVLIHTLLLRGGVGREGAAGSAGVGAVRGSRGPLGLFLVGIAEYL